MDNPANSETLFVAVKHWVVTTGWMMLGLLAGPLLLLAVPFFFVAIGADWEDLHDLALLFLVVSPFVVCFWTVLVNRYCNIKDDPDSGVLSKRTVRFVGAFLLGFIMPIVAEVCYISLSSRMAHVDNRVIWFLWFAGLDLAAFSPIILLLARRALSTNKGAGDMRAKMAKLAAEGMEFVEHGEYWNWYVANGYKMVPTRVKNAWGVNPEDPTGPCVFGAHLCGRPVAQS